MIIVHPDDYGRVKAMLSPFELPKTDTAVPPGEFYVIANNPAPSTDQSQEDALPLLPR